MLIFKQTTAHSMKRDKFDLKKATTAPTLSARDFFALQRLSKILNNPLEEFTSQGTIDVLLRSSRKKWTLRGLNSRPHAYVSPSCNTGSCEACALPLCQMPLRYVKAWKLYGEYENINGHNSASFSVFRVRLAERLVGLEGIH